MPHRTRTRAAAIPGWRCVAIFPRHSTSLRAAVSAPAARSRSSAARPRIPRSGPSGRSTSPPVTSSPSVRSRSALPRLDEVDTPALVVDGPTLVAEHQGDGRARPPRERRTLAAFEDSQVARGRCAPARARHRRVDGGDPARSGGLCRRRDRGHPDRVSAGWAASPRVIDLSKRIRLRVVLDDADIADALDDACRKAGRRSALWEVDCGTGRIGTEPGDRRAGDRSGCSPDAARLVRGPHGLRRPCVRGRKPGGDRRRGRGGRSRGARRPRRACGRWRRGVALSVGTTPTTHHLEREGRSRRSGRELRLLRRNPGDAWRRAARAVRLECARTVVARPSPTPAILDAGSKALAGEMLSPAQSGFGFVGATPSSLSPGCTRNTDRDVRGAEPDTVGERLAIVPNHACACVNLHDRMLVVEDGDVADVWASTPAVGSPVRRSPEASRRPVPVPVASGPGGISVPANHDLFLLERGKSSTPHVPCK